MNEIPTTINYGTVIVASSKGMTVGLEITEDHCNQGFALDPDVAYFYLPDHDGQCLLIIDKEAKNIELKSNYEWAIVVPFTINEDSVFVGTLITEEFEVAIRPDKYTVVFQVVDGEKEGKHAFRYLLYMSFVRGLDSLPTIFSRSDEPVSKVVLRNNFNRISVN